MYNDKHIYNNDKHIYNLFLQESKKINIHLILLLEF